MPADLASLDWAEKHRPRTLDEMVGNGAAVAELRAWAATWKDATPESERAVILAGDPGVGKTTAAHAIAREMGWGIVELNASDQRNEEAVKRVAGGGAVNRAFAFGEDGELAAGGRAGRQLVILDEADNLFGREDRGGMKAIIDTIRETKQPILLIANDYYELTRNGAALKTLAKTIKFTKVRSNSIPPAVRRMAEREGLELAPGVPEAIAERAGGDMRSVVNDLQALAAGRTRIALDDVKALGARDHTGDIWELLGKVFYGRSLDEARKASWDLDETPEDIALWIDENLPVMYSDPADLVDGYAALSRADVYLGRVTRRQQYSLWKYAGELMTGGVALAKVRKPAGARFQFPSWLRKQSAARSTRELRKRVASKVSEHVHVSTRVARQDMFPTMKAIMDVDTAFAEWAAWHFRLDADELAFLLDAKATDARVKGLLEGAAKRGAPPVVAKGVAAFGVPADAESDGSPALEEDALPKPASAPEKKPAKPARKKAAPKKVEPTEADDAEEGPSENAREEKPHEKLARKDDAAKRQKGLFDF